METFQSIQDWAHDTFGVAKPVRTLQRAEEEFEELIWEAVTPEDTLTEAADVIITLLNLPGIVEAINDKMAINRARKWKVFGDGTGQHE